jgi:hypothetical protein
MEPDDTDGEIDEQVDDDVEEAVEENFVDHKPVPDLPQSIWRTHYENLGEFVIVAIWLAQVLVIFCSANWIFGPKNSIHNFEASILVFLAITSVRSYDRIYKFIWKGYEKETWYGTKLVLYGVIVCFLFALVLELYNYLY